MKHNAIVSEFNTTRKLRNLSLLVLINSDIIKQGNLDWHGNGDGGGGGGGGDGDGGGNDCDD